MGWIAEDAQVILHRTRRRRSDANQGIQETINLGYGCRCPKKTCQHQSAWLQQATRIHAFPFPNRPRMRCRQDSLKAKRTRFVPGNRGFPEWTRSSIRSMNIVTTYWDDAASTARSDSNGRKPFIFSAPLGLM